MAAITVTIQVRDMRTSAHPGVDMQDHFEHASALPFPRFRQDGRRQKAEGPACVRLERLTIEELATKLESYRHVALRKAQSIMRNREDAEDCVQNAMLKALTGYAQFKGQSRVTTWFYSILYRECLIMLRKHKAEPLTKSFSDRVIIDNVEMDLIDSIDMADPAQTPDGQAMSKQHVDVILRGASLIGSELLRTTILELIHLDGGMRPNQSCTYKARIYRMRKQLGPWLEKRPELRGVFKGAYRGYSVL